MDMERVPITLLTGFLGAGKTTVLNAVLADNTAGRVAVIVNEFGEAGLDHDLIEESSEDIVLMRSGCLCCSVRGDLSNTVAGLFARRQAGEIAFERIVIETTGLADPAPILHTLNMDRFLVYSTCMDGIVTVADAANGAATLDAQFEAVSQAAMADVIALSKTDLVSSAKIQDFEDRLQALNPGVRILRSVKGHGLAGALWGLSAVDPKTTKQDVLFWMNSEQPAPDPLANLSDFAVEQNTSKPLPKHDTRIGTASVVLDDPVPDVAFDLWLDTLIALRGPDILRVKGIIFLEGLEAPFFFTGCRTSLILRSS